MKLTKRIIEKNVDGYVLKHREDFTENTYEVIQKLGKLEDLEEQLGCPLEVMFKALKQCEFEGLYFETKDTDGFKRKGFYKCSLSFSGFSNRFYWNCGWNAETWLDCYQKTWWLKKDKSE